MLSHFCQQQKRGKLTCLYADSLFVQRRKSIFSNFHTFPDNIQHRAVSLQQLSFPPQSTAVGFFQASRKAGNVEGKSLDT